MDGLAAPVRAGDTIAEKYVVDRVLGQGGMGVVVAASHATLNQRVALKFLLPDACDHPGAVERFLREARAAVQIQSEHVARVIDVGTLDTGSPYMVMEFLDTSPRTFRRPVPSTSLHQWAQKRRPPVAGAVAGCIRMHSDGCRTHC